MNNKKVYWLQVYALLAGVIFSWTTVVIDFMRFYRSEGTLLKVDNCLFPNPVTTPCFYGAIAFMVAFAWAVWLVGKEDAVRIKSQKFLMVFLSAGTAFAWSNFGILAYRFYTALPGQGVGCSGVPASSPFVTPCFYGSLLFLTALVISIVIRTKERKAQIL
ncbi:MAG: hypothetical protein WC791_00645 [Candidatus Paceibacterota bacterium]|jgi:hypothetical protein